MSLNVFGYVGQQESSYFLFLENFIHKISIRLHSLRHRVNSTRSSCKQKLRLFQRTHIFIIYAELLLFFTHYVKVCRYVYQYTAFMVADNHLTVTVSNCISGYLNCIVSTASMLQLTLECCFFLTQFYFSLVGFQFRRMKNCERSRKKVLY